MPRVNDVYQIPADSTFADGESASAVPVVARLESLEADANAVRPLLYGGTGASSVASAQTSLSIMPRGLLQNGTGTQIAEVTSNGVLFNNSQGIRFNANNSSNRYGSGYSFIQDFNHTTGTYTFRASLSSGAADSAASVENILIWSTAEAKWLFRDGTSDVITFDATGATLASGMQIVCDAGSASAPAIRGSDADTGFGFPSTANIAVYVAGSQTVAFTAAGIELQSGEQLICDDGSASAPAIRGSDADTGIDFPATANIGINIAGSQTVLFTPSGIVLQSGEQLLCDAGTASDPSIRGVDDADTGFYFPSTANIGVVAAGSLTASFTTTGIEMGAGAQLVCDSGSAAAPAIRGSDADCGIRFDGDQTRIVSAGADVFRAGSTELYAIEPIRCNAGSSTAVSLRFGTAVNTGFYGGTTSVGLSVSGTEVLTAASFGINFPQRIAPATTASINLGTPSNAWATVYYTTLTEASDARFKTEIQDIPARLLDAWEDLRILLYKRIAEVDKEGAGAKLHAGVVAQNIDAIVKRSGLDPDLYGLFKLEEFEPGVWRYTIAPMQVVFVELAWQRRKNKEQEKINKHILDELAQLRQEVNGISSLGEAA